MSRRTSQTGVCGDAGRASKNGVKRRGGTLMARRRFKPRTSRATRSLAAAGVSVLGLVAAGCSTVSFTPSLDDELHARLAHMVESAQDDLWWYRDALAADPEATLPQIDFVSDARPSYDDPALVPGGGTYTLLGVSSSPEGTSLTLATSAGASSGGGWFYQSRSAAVCFTLHLPLDDAAIQTSASDCTDGRGHGLSDVADYARHGEPVSLDVLDVRRTVTEEDYRPLPCRCSSGGDCDCPGG